MFILGRLRRGIISCISFLAFCCLLFGSAIPLVGQTGTVRYFQRQHRHRAVANNARLHRPQLIEASYGGSYQQPPIGGAHVYLYEVGMGGPNTGPVSLLNTSLSPVQTDAAGNGYIVTDSSGGFSISGLYAMNCGSGPGLTYLVAKDGSIGGLPVNGYTYELVAIQVPCSLMPTQLCCIGISEPTTVAAALALAAFADTGDEGFSTNLASTNALTDAFAYANTLANSFNGNPEGTPGTLADIDTISDILAYCVDSAGDSNSPCPAMVAYATGPNGVVPVDTWQTVVAMVENPTLNLQNLYDAYSPASPYQPTFSSAPSSWDVSISGAPFITGLATSFSSSGNILTIYGTNLNVADYVILDGAVVSVKAAGAGNIVVIAPAGPITGVIQVYDSSLNLGSNPVLTYPTATTITSSANPATYGDNSFLTATVIQSLPGGIPPTGSVTFLDGGVSLAVVAINSSGVATLPTASLNLGTNTLVASYSGDAKYQTSSSAPYSEVLQQLATLTTLVVPASGNYAGNPLLLVVTITDQGNIPVSGPVSCSVTGVSGTFTGTAASGTVTVATSALAIGSYSVGCSYLGSIGLAPSTSSTQTASVVATPQPTWAQNGSMTSPRASHTATLLNDGTVLLAGGINNTPDCSFRNRTCLPFSPLNTAEIYSPTAQTTTALASTMQFPREGPTATLLPNGQVLITSGSTVRFAGSIPNPDSPTVSADIYDPPSQTFSPTTGNMNFPRGCGATATLLQNGTVLIVGSSSGNAAEIYDPSTSTFTTTGTPVVPRISGFTATILQNGNVLFTGGSTSLTCNYAVNDVNDQDIVDTAEIYYPATGKFVATGAMKSSRMLHTATLLSTGKVLIVGGTPDMQNGLNTAELYDPLAGTFSYSSNTLDTARAGQSADPLANGLILIAGGRTEVGGTGGTINVVSSAEVYDPTQDTFMSTTSMNTARFLASNVVLVTGQVFNTGGTQAPSTPNVLSSMESYVPPTVSGWVNPKYIVVGVSYSLPGTASSLTYNTSVTQGNTTTITNSSASASGISVSVGMGTGFGIPGLSFVMGNVQTTASSSSTYTQGSMSSNAITLTKIQSFGQSPEPVPDPNNVVDHRYDIIYVWINPLVLFTVDPSVPGALVWNGYGFDPNDPTGQQDIIGIPAGMLTGALTMDPALVPILARTWATNQSWPAGQGPELNAADLMAIAEADPFFQCQFTNSTLSFTNCFYPNYNTAGANFGPPAPSTSVDTRFSKILNLNSSGYLAPISFIQGDPKTPYSASTTNTNVQTNQSSHSFQQVFGVDFTFSLKAGLGFFFSNAKVDTKLTQTLTFTHSFQETLTNTTMNGVSFTIAPPACTAGVCNTYTGPGQFLVYLDNIYGTLMFYPIQ